MNGIASRLRMLRGSESQKEFSSTIGLKQTTYGKYERGITSPNMETASLICRKLGLNPRWLILGEEPMYDAEASQKRPEIKGKDLEGKSVDELPADIQKPVKKTMRGAQVWRQRWDELPDWAKDYIEELEEELDKAKAELLKAKDEAIQALKSRGSMIDTIPDVLLLAKALKAAGALESPEQFPEVNIDGLRKLLDEQPKK